MNESASEIPSMGPQQEIIKAIGTLQETLPVVRVEVVSAPPAPSIGMLSLLAANL